MNEAALPFPRAEQDPEGRRRSPETLWRFESASPPAALAALGALLSTPPSRGRRWLTETCSMKEVPYLRKYHHSKICKAHTRRQGRRPPPAAPPRLQPASPPAPAPQPARRGGSCGRPRLLSRAARGRHLSASSPPEHTETLNGTQV